MVAAGHGHCLWLQIGVCEWISHSKMNPTVIFTLLHEELKGMPRLHSEDINNSRH